MTQTFENLQREHRAELVKLTTSNILGDINRLARLHHDITAAHFKTKLPEYIEKLGFEEGFICYLNRIAALQHTEICEMTEEARKETLNWQAIVEEEVDSVLRALNALTTIIELGVSTGHLAKETCIGGLLYAKMAKNVERPLQHGGKRF